MTYTIADDCVVCWKCIDVCPADAIQDTEITITLNYTIPGVEIIKEKCVDCGKCMEVCPVDAIIKKNDLCEPEK